MLELKEGIKPIEKWGMFDTFPLMISGPCSAETRDQVLETARLLKNRDPHIQLFRAGVWKPRTRPSSFQGVGEVALEWLKEVKEETGFKTCVEVGQAKHVELSLKNNIDVLWLGARTTVNPFAVQEIADSLKGVDIPILIKNPINPDFNLWLGAIERIFESGIRRIACIHRGFSSTLKSQYRNIPLWNFPIEMKRTLPNVSMICDPSHICGNRDLLKDISQTALDLAFDGLMLEAHPDPESALSDKEQQLKPDDLIRLLREIKIRDAESETGQLELYRREIDAIDSDLMHNLSRRFKIVRLIGEHKKEYNLSVLQVERWKAILSDKLERSGDLELNPEFIKKVYEAIHLDSVYTQTEIIQNDKKKTDGKLVTEENS